MDISELAYSLDTVWVLLAAFLVFFMQAGFALVEAGFTQSKNAVNILMKNFADFTIASLVFFCMGYGIMFGAGNGFMGKEYFFLHGLQNDAIPGLAFFLFQTVFAGTTATIVSGAMAERTKFGSYLLASAIMTALIYPIVGHWTWGGGWLSDLGFIDFAGSGVVHTVGGVAGLAGAMLLGPRKGAFNPDSHVHKGHNVTFAGLGVFILWLGWFGFNPGSQVAASGMENANAIALIAVNTNLAAAAGSLLGMLLSWMKLGKPNIGMTLNGALAGLVAITAGCASVTPLAAIAIGAIGSVAMYAGVTLLWKLRIDDPVGAVSVHGVAGIWGVLAVGLFDPSADFVVQATGIVSIVVWTALTSVVLFGVLKATVGLRVSGSVEDEGLDTHEHGVVAYA
ncbi:ammonium transporter [Candidatus Peregrinibacteria bacterium CG10_big_fil_rev_8_21_14_0_10_49_24]|nr:MAG: ammonium transporter [Candidatus Peregrinibacteria bacterium CG11_big_fil_rev_8_21_14_0_20_49_14]PIR50750.1 MAG: ammonium transporter [Candidatus Peregrinibacteria bacterium CG10_big_fil_rev_8_21_14_0_10_49_24]PJA68205.1 MAG: ammonium transporter [Candidatus Peregrinibacteria bacterium CG_4_9_14_3_um_filter_49_12]